MADYSNPGPGADASTGAAPPPAGEEPQHNTVHIPSDMFPGDMVKTLKAGEVIEFRIVSPVDKDGDVEIEYNHGEEAPGAEAGEKEEPWEDDFRKEMSPRAEQKEAV